MVTIDDNLSKSVDDSSPELEVARDAEESKEPVPLRRSKSSFLGKKKPSDSSVESSVPFERTNSVLPPLAKSNRIDLNETAQATRDSLTAEEKLSMYVDDSSPELEGARAAEESKEPVPLRRSKSSFLGKKKTSDSSVESSVPFERTNSVLPPLAKSNRIDLNETAEEKLSMYVDDSSPELEGARAAEESKEPIPLRKSKTSFLGKKKQSESTNESSVPIQSAPAVTKSITKEESDKYSSVVENSFTIEEKMSKSVDDCLPEMEVAMAEAVPLRRSKSSFMKKKKSVTPNDANVSLPSAKSVLPPTYNSKGPSSESNSASESGRSKMIEVVPLERSPTEILSNKTKSRNKSDVSTSIQNDPLIPFASKDVSARSDENNQLSESTEQTSTSSKDSVIVPNVTKSDLNISFVGDVKFKNHCATIAEQTIEMTPKRQGVDVHKKEQKPALKSALKPYSSYDIGSTRQNEETSHVVFGGTSQTDIDSSPETSTMKDLSFLIGIPKQVTPEKKVDMSKANVARGYSANEPIPEMDTPYSSPTNVTADIYKNQIGLEKVAQMQGLGSKKEEGWVEGMFSSLTKKLDNIFVCGVPNPTSNDTVAYK